MEGQCREKKKGLMLPLQEMKESNLLQDLDLEIKSPKRKEARKDTRIKKKREKKKEKTEGKKKIKEKEAINLCGDPRHLAKAEQS